MVLAKHLKISLIGHAKALEQILIYYIIIWLLPYYKKFGDFHLFESFNKNWERESEEILQYKYQNSSFKKLHFQKKKLEKGCHLWTFLN